MALTKIINDATQSFRPVLTDKLVLDATPTEGSYNGVTSDGVAKAIAEGGGGSEELFFATYGETPWSDIRNAYSDGKIPVCNYQNTVYVLTGCSPLTESATFGALSFADGFTVSSTKYVHVVDTTWTHGEIAGGSSLEAGTAIKIADDKISVNYDGDALTLKTDTVRSRYNSYDDTTRNISFEPAIGDSPITASTKCDWGFGKDGSSFTIMANSEQAGCQLRAALYDSNAQLLSVSSHGVVSWGMPKTLYEGMNNFSGVQWESEVRPSGRTFGDEFPLAEGKTYQDAALIALVAYNTTSNEVVGNPFMLPSDSDFEFVIETDANSRITVLCNPNSLEVQSPLGLSVKNPVPSTYGMPQGSVLTIGEYGIAWEQPSGGGDVFWAEENQTSFDDIWDAVAAGKIVLMCEESTFPADPTATIGKIYTLVYIRKSTLPSASTAIFGNVFYDSGVHYLQTLTVKGDGSYSSSRDSGYLIPYFDPASDEGKVLKIVNGELAWATP